MIGHEAKKGRKDFTAIYPFDGLEATQGFYVPVRGGAGDQTKASTPQNVANLVSKRNKKERKAGSGKRYSWRLYNPDWLIVWRIE